VDADLRPDILPLAGLVATWLGHGEGSYPTIDGSDLSATMTRAT
jgi:hypothetical protein